MNKSELVKEIAESAGISQKEAKVALDALVKTITAAIARGEQVSISGFGSFSLRKRAARSGRNPRTGAFIKIPSSKVAAFKAGAKLKSAVLSDPTGGGGPGKKKD